MNFVNIINTAIAILAMYVKCIPKTSFINANYVVKLNGCKKEVSQGKNWGT